jgi:hypothetical protein
MGGSSDIARTNGQPSSRCAVLLQNAGSGGSAEATAIAVRS